MKAVKEYVVDGVRVHKNSVAASFIEEGRQEVIQSMLKHGLPIQEVAKIAGVSESALQDLVTNLEETVSEEATN